MPLFGITIFIAPSYESFLTDLFLDPLIFLKTFSVLIAILNKHTKYVCIAKLYFSLYIIYIYNLFYMKLHNTFVIIKAERDIEYKNIYMWSIYI